MTRGETWTARLLLNAMPVAGYPTSVRVVDGTIAEAAYRAIAVVADPANRFARARLGEVGLDEALGVVDAVRSAPAAAALVAVVDLPGQAFGRREEAAGLHVALGAMVDAYVSERRGGRQIFGLLVGKAISGGFLAHGAQAGWIGALDDPGVEVHVMSAPSVARVTRSSADEVARIAAVVRATARDIRTFGTFGAIDRFFTVAKPDAPTEAEFEEVRSALSAARNEKLGLRTPLERLGRGRSAETRAVAIDTRRRIRDVW